ncbi:MAG: beta-ketoacyl synthase N-terminal-like domain-containing protein, partial [Desulfosudaceae bacterium]
MSVYITGIGVVSALGRGWRETAAALRNNHGGLGPLTLFPHASSLAVGEVKQKMDHPDLPRTHQIALAAAEEALLSRGRKIPEAVVIGVTTGGMPRTELLLKQDAYDPASYEYHAAGSVAEYIAGYCNCKGPALTVSTACSSGALAVAIGTMLVRSGLARTVLVGGVDAL